jgi:hypothetical protein
MNRTHGTYQTEGRWQNEREARELDTEIAGFLDEYGIPYERIDNDATKIVARVQQLIKEYEDWDMKRIEEAFASLEGKSNE